MRSDNPKNNKNVMESLKNNKNVATKGTIMSKEERRNELNDSNGSAKQIGETIEYGDWYQDPFDGWSQVSNDPIEGDVLVGKHVTKDGTFFKQNK